MPIVNIHEAKTCLARLLELAEAGDEIIIAKDGKPVARILPFEEEERPRVPGTGRGEIRIAEDFYDDLPDFE